MLQSLKLLFALVLSLASLAPAQTIQLANHGEFPFVGWLSTTVDTRPALARGVTADGVPWVLGRQIGAEAWMVDVRVKLPAGGRLKVALDGSKPGGAPVAELPADLIAHFGGVPSVGGVPMSLVGWQPDGSAILVQLRARLDTPFVVDLWLRWYPGQGWAQGEAMLVASDPRSPALTSRVRAAAITFGDAVVFIPGSGFAPVAKAGEVFADGQGRAVPLLLVWPRLLGRGSDWSSVGALADSKLGAVGIERVYPQGNPRLPKNWDAMAWAVSKYQPALAGLMTWDAPVLGANKNSADTGAQGDQVFVAGEPMALPGAELPIYWAALKMAARPCQHREADGSMLDPDWHVEPRLILWDSRPHWHTGVSPDRLGKPRDLSVGEAQGWWGPDVEHWLYFTVSAAHRYTGSRALDYVLRQQAVNYLLQWTTTPGWSTSQPYASRAIGWECAMVVLLDRELEDRAMASRVVAHWRVRMDTITLPFLESPGHTEFWDIRVDDPRLGPGAWWIPWQQSVGAYWMFVAGERLGGPLRARLSRCAVIGANAVVRDAWRQQGTGWVTSANCAVNSSTSPADGSFNFFGMALAPATLLLAGEGTQLAKARAIWPWLDANAEKTEQVRWMAPGVR